MRSLSSAASARSYATLDAAQACPTRSKMCVLPARLAPMAIDARGVSRARAVASRKRADLKLHAVAAEADTPATQDAWIAAALQVFPASNGRIGALNGSAREALASARMPTTRDEEFKFTDLSDLVKASLCAPAEAAVFSGEQKFPEAQDTLLAIVDGRIDMRSSRLGGVPEGVFVGRLADAPDWVLEKLGAQTTEYGNVLATLNSALASDVAVVAIPGGIKMSAPLHVLTIASSGTTPGQLPTSAPRMLICLGRDAAAEVVEEFQATGTGEAFTTSVTEVELAEGAVFKHGILQLSVPNAGTHAKTTLVKQATNSCYKLVESRLGGRLTRHDVRVEQLGPDTNTTMRHFLLCGTGQLHDLHTKLVLDHPRAIASQLHKCIAATPTSRGVFDGNVKVQRRAQQTDAGQLSRNLLLAPRATVNVKPNLQIIADDVKCTHGCTVSDLSEEELFYFASRGIDAQTARNCLVYSFGAEVLQEHGYETLRKRLGEEMKDLLK